MRNDKKMKTLMTTKRTKNEEKRLNLSTSRSRAESNGRLTISKSSQSVLKLTFVVPKPLTSHQAPIP